MPTLPNHDGFLGKREWRNTVGQSGMTPTAFAFLIPVFVVVVFAPFLCVFCVRRRQRSVMPLPAVRKVKKPALRREQARERLRQLTDVAAVTGGEKKTEDGQERREEVPVIVADNASIAERECAICLSTLHAPSPPEPALLSSESTSTPSPMSATLDESAMSAPITPGSEPILALHTCSHAFHAECLVSWFVLRKTTCPICRTAYISTEDMQAYEEEEAGIVAGEMEQMAVVEPGNEVAPGNAAAVDGTRVSNWRYFWAGESVMARENGGSATRQGALDVESGQVQTGRRWAFGR